MNTIQFRQLIQESIQDYIREIDMAGDIAALEAKLEKIEEEISIREKKINKEGIDETMHDLIDEKKLQVLQKEVNVLRKKQVTYENQLEKLKAKQLGKSTEKPEAENVEIVEPANASEEGAVKIDATIKEGPDDGDEDDDYDDGEPGDATGDTEDDTTEFHPGTYNDHNSPNYDVNRLEEKRKAKKKVKKVVDVDMDAEPSEPKLKFGSPEWRAKYSIGKGKGKKKVEVNEDLSMVGDIALGVAGGLVGLYLLVKGAGYVKNFFGDAAWALANALEKKVVQSHHKMKKENISSIIEKFEGDEQLASMYEALPEKTDKNKNERAKQLKVIASYIKSKLTTDEMKYFEDISSMLRTGEMKENEEEPLNEQFLYMQKLAGVITEAQYKQKMYPTILG